MSASHDKQRLAALDELFYQVNFYRHGKDVRELFEFINKFPQLAPFNAFLLHVQKPGSQYVATATEWRQNFNRRIRPGARPLVILQPFGPVRFVFELGDTEGPEPFPAELLRPFRTGGVLPASVFKQLLGNLPRDGIAFHEADLGTGSAGWIEVALHHDSQWMGKKQVRVCYHLVVNRNHSREEQFATIAHELGHLYCGHLGTPDSSWWPDRWQTAEDVREFEAESVAWLVCKRVGIVNPSAAYLITRLRDEDEIPPVSLEAILKAAGMVEALMFRSLRPRKALVINA